MFSQISHNDALDKRGRIIREKQLCPMLSVSSATLRRMISAGEFPSPFRISKQAVGFDLQEVEAWLEARKAARNEVLQ